MSLAEGTYVSPNSSEATMDETATNIAALELQNRGGQNGHLTNICELGPSREPCWCHRGGAPGVKHLWPAEQWPGEAGHQDHQDTAWLPLETLKGDLEGLI